MWFDTKRSSVHVDNLKNLKQTNDKEGRKFCRMVGGSDMVVESEFSREIYHSVVCIVYGCVAILQDIEGGNVVDWLHTNIHNTGFDDGIIKHQLFQTKPRASLFIPTFPSTTEF